MYVWLQTKQLLVECRIRGKHVLCTEYTSLHESWQESAEDSALIVSAGIGVLDKVYNIDQRQILNGRGHRFPFLLIISTSSPTLLLFMSIQLLVEYN